MALKYAPKFCHRLMTQSIGKKTIDKKTKLYNNLSCYLMCGLPILGFFIFGLIPLGISMWLGFQTLPSLNFTRATFNGINNFTYVIKDPLFHKAIRNTIISILSLPISMVIGFLIAYVLTQNKIKGKSFLRALFFIPYICSAVAVTYVFKTMFNTEYGVINAIFSSGINFFMEPVWFMAIVIIIMVWTGTGFYIILYQAALTSVNQSTLEAASIDGASAFRKIRSIIIPAVSPTTFYLLVTGIIGGLQNFTWFQILCDPMKNAGLGYGPNDVGITMVYYLYTKAFGSSGATIQGGYAAAAAILLSGGILLLTIFNFGISKKWVHYE